MSICGPSRGSTCPSCVTANLSDLVIMPGTECTSDTCQNLNSASQSLILTFHYPTGRRGQNKWYEKTQEVLIRVVMKYTDTHT